MTKKARELFETEITAKPEVLLEIMKLLEMDAFTRWQPGENQGRYRFHAFSSKGDYELIVSTVGFHPPLKVIREVSRSLNCDIGLLIQTYSPNLKVIKSIKYVCVSGNLVGAREVKIRENQARRQLREQEFLLKKLRSGQSYMINDPFTNTVVHGGTTPLSLGEVFEIIDINDDFIDYHKEMEKVSEQLDFTNSSSNK